MSPNDKSSGASDKKKQQKNKEKRQSQENNHGSSNVKVWARNNRGQGTSKKDSQHSSKKSADQQKSFADQKDVYRPGASDQQGQRQDVSKKDTSKPIDRQKSYADQNDVYRPGISDQQQSRAPVDQKQTKAKDDVVRFSDHVVEVKKLSHEMFNKEQRDGLKDASNRASINTIEHAQEVSRAVKDFEKYAEGKIKQMEGKVTAGQLAVSLADAALTVLAPEAKLTAKITSKVGQNLVKKIYGNLKKELVKDVGNAAKSTSANDLKKVVSTLARQAGDRAAVLRKSVDKAIGEQVNPIKDKLERGKELNPQEQAFVGSVFMGSKEQVDRALHEQGFPNPDKAYGDVLRSLVTQFEKHHIKATYSWNKKMTMGFEEWEKNSLDAPGGLAAAAKAKADAFVNQRLQERAKVKPKGY